MVLIIAEVAGAHEAKPEQMLRLIDAAKTSNADAVKLQIYQADSLAVPSHPLYHLYQELEYNEHEWEQVINHARKLRLALLADIFDVWGLQIMEKYGAQGYKLHPTVLWEEELLALVAATGKPIYLGVGGVSHTEIDKALKTLAKNGAEKITLVHGFQSYPTKLVDTNLLRMTALKEYFGLPVAFADHVDADSQLSLILPLVAIGCGADVIEKHITMDRSKKGPDYYSSLNPDEFSTMVKLIRDIERALGTKSHMAEAEGKYIKSIVRRIVASKPIEAGELITRGKIAFKRVGEENGLLPNDKDKVLHKRAKKSIDTSELVMPDKVEPVCVGVLIAIRMKSTRLHKKVLLEIEGKSLIGHLIERVKKASLADVIIVCTSTHPDDAILTEIAGKEGVKSFVGSEDNVVERFLEAARQEGVDIIVRVTGDCPLIDPEYIDKAIAHLLTKDADYVRVVGMPVGTHCEVFHTKALEKICDLAGDSDYSEYMTFYFINNPETFHIEEIECDEAVRRPTYRLTVDEATDAELMKEIYGRLYQGGRVFPLKEVIELLDSNPDLVDINKETKLKWRDDKEFVKLLNEKTKFRRE